ncbi:hypothetical protein ACIRST_42055 [Kitasatospora sp. NPDC101447]|uniref:hypothetical protein n=1 Tax=Kitasatospora sp. NPDC101447 TaxID=3364102 RepID=UPI0037FCFCED
MSVTSTVRDNPSDTANPYPGADKGNWTKAFSDALALATGLPLEITDGIAPYVVRPKDFLTRTGGAYQLRPGVITVDPGTGLQVLNVTVHGFTGAPGEYNERIRGSFHSPTRPNPDPIRMLPRLTTGTGTDGRALPYLATAHPVPANTLSSLIGVMESALNDADGSRGYKLTDDIRTYGQNESTLHAVLLRTVAENGSEAKVRRVLDLTAIKGANRSRARLGLFGLSAKDIVFGVDRAKLVALPESGEYPARIADPAVWVPAFAESIRAAYTDERHPLHEVALNAEKVATVQIGIIVGTAHPDEFHNVVFDPNRADHRRPPLGYSLAEKAASDMRAVLRDAKANGWLTESERAWLAGEGADTFAHEGEDLVTARDRRDRTLFAVVFPEDPDRIKAVARVLGEPKRSYTGKDHVANRLRMVSAVANAGYRYRWNPRVLDGLLGSTFIKTNGQLALPAWREALDKGIEDQDVLHEFLTTRGIHWLAEYKIIDADRGSIGAQAGGHDNDPEDQAETAADRKIRRSTISARGAMLAKPRRAVALMRELAEAANENRDPRAVDNDGVPLDGTVADKHWFDEQFPKTAKKKTPLKGRDSETDSSNPGKPDPTPQEALAEARSTFYSEATNHAPRAAVDLLEAAREFIAAAQHAGQNVTLADDEERGAIVQALVAAQSDIQNLLGTVAMMQFSLGHVQESQAEKFLTEASGDDE